MSDEEDHSDEQYRVPDFMEGAKFIKADEERRHFTRNVSRYTTTRQSISRMNELRGIFTWNDVEETIQHGVMVPGSQETMVFGKDFDGISFYVVVLHKEDDKFDREEHPIKTVWVYVRDRGRAWGAGYTGEQLDKIEELTPDDQFEGHTP